MRFVKYPRARYTSSSGVPATPTGCTEARAKFQRDDGFSGETVGVVCWDRLSLDRSFSFLTHSALTSRKVSKIDAENLNRESRLNAILSARAGVSHGPERTRSR